LWISCPDLPLAEWELGSELFSYSFGSFYPVAVLKLPVVLPERALSPMAVLLLPVVLLRSASTPMAVSKKPEALLPRAAGSERGIKKHTATGGVGEWRAGTTNGRA